MKRSVKVESEQLLCGVFWTWIPGNLSLALDIVSPTVNKLVTFILNPAGLSLSQPLDRISKGGRCAPSLGGPSAVHVESSMSRFPLALMSEILTTHHFTIMAYLSNFSFQGLVCSYHSSLR